MSMQPLITHQGIIIPLNRANIDTDMLLPKQYLKSLEASGFGAFLFDDERYLDPGEIDTPLDKRRENPACILNQPPYRQGSVVLIFRNNCFNNGVLPLLLEQAAIDELFALAEAQPGLQAEVDVERRLLSVSGGVWCFELDEGRRQRLLKGLDEVGESLCYGARISAYEERRRLSEPWLFRS
jgi:3-isopropylmalate/(R)-2-methylmalate dehydratase small subunit